MKTIKNIILVLVAQLLLNNNSVGQLQQFSQYYSSPMVLAPSFTGLIEGSRIVVNYRDQWPGIPGTFITYGMGYDQYFPRWHSGFGLLALRDQAGSGNLALTEIALLYSFNFKLDNNLHIRPGINFSYNQRSVDFTKLIFGDQIVDQNGAFSVLPNTTEVLPSNQIRYPNVASSILLYSGGTWGGITWDNMLHPNQSFLGGDASLPYKWSFFFGKRWDFNSARVKFTEESITATFLYRKMDVYDQMDIGVYWTNTPIVLGLYLRGMPYMMQAVNGYDNLDAVIVLVGYKMENLSIGYTYDVTISKLINSSHGSHEISLIYEFNADMSIHVNRSREAIPCPRF